MPESRPGRRVAIVAGVRTPFAKSGTAFADVSAVSLARHAARELLYRSEVDGREVDEVIFSQVVPSVLAPNVGREVSLLPQLLPSIPAYTLNRACASSAQAIGNAADQIALGHADTVLAGGVESLSDIPILHSRRFSRVLVDASRAKSVGGRLAAFRRARPRDLVPVTPAIAEPSTGESMGEAAEKMAKANDITRDEQDQIALRSHQNAARAWADGTGCRGDARPAPAVRHRRRPGQPGAATARSRRSPSSRRRSTGARSMAATPRRSPTVPARLLLCESRARALGYEPLGFVRTWAYAAVDPGWRLLMAPVFAAPKALDRAGLTLARHRPRGHARGLRRAGRLEPPGHGVAQVRRSASAAPRRWVRSTPRSSTSTAARSPSATPSPRPARGSPRAREQKRRRKQSRSSPFARPAASAPRSSWSR